jgi:hypothetical protein
VGIRRLLGRDSEFRLGLDSELSLKPLDSDPSVWFGWDTHTIMRSSLAFSRRCSTLYTFLAFRIRAGVTSFWKGRAWVGEVGILYQQRVCHGHHSVIINTININAITTTSTSSYEPPRPCTLIPSSSYTPFRQPTNHLLITSALPEATNPKKSTNLEFLETIEAQKPQIYIYTYFKTSKETVKEEGFPTLSFSLCILV